MASFSLGRLTILMQVFTAGRRLTLGSALLGARRILTEGAGRSISRGKWDAVSSLEGIPRSLRDGISAVDSV